jgi:hypothetical protein
LGSFPLPVVIFGSEYGKCHASVSCYHPLVLGSAFPQETHSVSLTTCRSLFLSSVPQVIDIPCTQLLLTAATASLMWLCLPCVPASYFSSSMATFTWSEIGLSEACLWLSHVVLEKPLVVLCCWHSSLILHLGFHRHHVSLCLQFFCCHTLNFKQKDFIPGTCLML